MSATVKDIEDALFQWAPASLAEEWDNVGLQCGDPDGTVKKVIIALDVSPATLSHALANNADLVISHHPLIFKPLSCLNLKDYTARLLAGFLRHQISVISMHTNLDSCIGGVNDRLCKLLDIVDTSPLLPNEITSDAGLGRIGLLKNSMNQEQFLEHVRKGLSLKCLSFAGSHKGPISKVAVCSGSGSTLLAQAISKGADAFVTGEVKHSVAREAEDMNILIVDGGHFATERPVVIDIHNYLAQIAKEAGWELELLIFEEENTPVNFWPGCKI